MRRPSLLPLSFASLACLALASATGCASLYQLDDYKLAGESANENVPPPEEAAPTPSSSDGGTTSLGPACSKNADCNPNMVKGTSLGKQTFDPNTASSVCVKATKTCAPLLSADCPAVTGEWLDDDAVIVGSLLGATESPLDRAIVLAAEELNSPNAGGGLPPETEGGQRRPLVVLRCDGGGSSAPNSVRAARHLVDELRVPAIVGPTNAEGVIDVTQQASMKGGTLVMTPTSLVSPITKLADNGLTWRNVSNDTQRAKLVIQQMNEIEGVIHTIRPTTTVVKLGVVHRADMLGLSARDSISGKLVINNKFIADPANAANVSVDSYTRTDDEAGLATIVNRYASTFKPDIVFITAPEQAASLIVPLEAALTAARATARPYYVCTDEVKTDALIEALKTAGLPADIKRRIRGVGARSDASSSQVYSAFSAAYNTRFGEAPTPSAAASYDALYAIAYGLAATASEPVTGANVAKGLGALGVGETFSVGATNAGFVMQTLASHKSVSMRGTFSLLQWDGSGDIAGGTVEVWCVGGGAGAPTFGSSGLTMDVQTQVVAGSFLQCQ